MQAEPLAPGLFRLTRPRGGGWALHMNLVALPRSGLLVHSPTLVADDVVRADETFTAVAALGAPRALMAPNHFHHLWLAPFRERWPDARAVASREALPRLAQKGHTGLRELEEVDTLLPPDARWLRCEGTRSGEAWLSLPGEAGPTWLVGDAFFHLPGPLRGPVGLALRALRVAPGLRVSRTYRWLALSDPARYAAWARDTVARERPRRIVFSHGDPLEADDLGDRLLAALAEAFDR